MISVNKRLLSYYKKIKLTSKFNKVARNVSWLIVDKIFRMGVGLIISVWLARYLGPDNFGSFNYAIAFVALFSAVATLGLDSIVIREIIKKDNINELLGTVFTLKVVGGFVAFGLSTISIYLFKPEDIVMCVLVVFVALSMIFQAFDVIDFWYQANVISKYTVIARSSAFIILSIIRLIFILSKAPLVAFALLYSLEIMLGAVFLVISYLKLGNRIRTWTLNINKGIKLLKNSWPLILSSVVVTLYMKIDQLMIGQMLGSEKVGIYSSAVRLVEVWYFIPTAIAASLYPSIIEAKQLDEKKYYSNLQRLYNIMTWIGIAIALPTTFISGYVINILYGQQYIEASSVLSLSIWSGIFVFQGVARSNWLIIENLQKYNFYFLFFTCLLNVGLNYILIPIYSIHGAAVATLISQFTAAILAPALFSKTRKSSIMLLKSFYFGK